jgi:hypothetical protein
VGEPSGGEEGSKYSHFVCKLWNVHGSIKSEHSPDFNGMIRDCKRLVSVCHFMCVSSMILRSF